MASEKIGAIDLRRLLPKIEKRLNASDLRNLKDGLSAHDVPPLQITGKLYAELLFSRNDLERIMGLFGFSTPGYHLKIFSEEGKGGFFAILWDGYNEPKSIHDAIGTLSVKANQDGVYSMRWAGISSEGIMAAQYGKSSDGCFYLTNLDIGLKDRNIGIKSVTEIADPYARNAGVITQNMVNLTRCVTKQHFFAQSHMPEQSLDRFTSIPEPFRLSTPLSINPATEFVQVRKYGQKLRDTVPFKIKQK